MERALLVNEKFQNISGIHEAEKSLIDENSGDKDIARDVYRRGCG